MAAVQGTVSTSYSSDSSGIDRTKTNSRSQSTAYGIGRTHTSHPRTALSMLTGIDNQEVVCAVIESRGTSPTVGLAFVNLDTCEVVMSQICDSQTYVRSVHKLSVYGPSQILIPRTAVLADSKLISVLEENMPHSEFVDLDRAYWAESTGIDYIQQLAFAQDVASIRASTRNSFFAVCCLSAVLKYVERALGRTFAFHSLRMKYEPSEGTMMIDVGTINNLELIQNLHDPTSKASLFGLLNETQTPMGARLLRNNVLQPLTNADTLNLRYDAVDELTSQGKMLFAVRAALKEFAFDTDKLLTSLIVAHPQGSWSMIEQSVNNIVMLRHFASYLKAVHEALTGAGSTLLAEIRELCSPGNVEVVQGLINAVINEDVKFSKSPLDLRYQRVFAVKSGVNGLLEVARQTFKENSDDVAVYAALLQERHNIKLDVKYDSVRQFYIRFPQSALEKRTLPAEFINIVRQKGHVQCSTLQLAKRNQKIVDSHNECLLMSSRQASVAPSIYDLICPGDRIVQKLIVEIRHYASALFKICEGIAMLDMVSSFSNLVTRHQYVRPDLCDTFAIKDCRHPIKENNPHAKFVPNDVYATEQNRFQIITGKSTYIRSVALTLVMAQIGSFVPATYASFPIKSQLFARIGVDDSVESNVSTFASEMQETAFILRNIDNSSLAIVDELGRGTGTRDGLAIAIAVSEALVASRALVWFATHFVELASALADRNGVINLHLEVETTDAQTMTPSYRISAGAIPSDRHYGLGLARVVPLPPGIVEHATYVSNELNKQADRQRHESPALLIQRRRRLILALREHLTQAQQGTMDRGTLAAWLKELQNQFIVKMSALIIDDGQVVERGAEQIDDGATSIVGSIGERV